MLNFLRILFPLDFSDRCKQTAPYVAGIARKCHSQITLLHALDMSQTLAAPLLRREMLTSCEDSIRRRRESELEEFAPGVFDGLLVTRVVELGDPAAIITRYAERNEIDLITLPTHGLGTFRWLLLGSVTSKVLHDSACAVWTTVHSEALPPTEAKEIRTIICGVDLYSEPVRIIEAASDMAANYGGLVQLVHAVYVPEARPGSDIYTGLKRFLFDAAGELIAKCQQEAGTNWEVCIQSGSVSSVLRDAIVHSEADLVVIGRGRLQNRFGRLRTNVGAIIRDSPCPVLSV